MGHDSINPVAYLTTRDTSCNLLRKSQTSYREQVRSCIQQPILHKNLVESCKSALENWLRLRRASRDVRIYFLPIFQAIWSINWDYTDAEQYTNHSRLFGFASRQCVEGLTMPQMIHCDSCRSRPSGGTAKKGFSCAATCSPGLLDWLNILKTCSHHLYS